MKQLLKPHFLVVILILNRCLVLHSSLSNWFNRSFVILERLCFSQQKCWYRLKVKVVILNWLIPLADSFGQFRQIGHFFGEIGNKTQELVRDPLSIRKISKNDRIDTFGCQNTSLWAICERLLSRSANMVQIQPN